MQDVTQLMEELSQLTDDEISSVFVEITKRAPFQFDEGDSHALSSTDDFEHLVNQIVALSDEDISSVVVTAAIERGIARPKFVGSSDALKDPVYVLSKVNPSSNLFHTERCPANNPIKKKGQLTVAIERVDAVRQRYFPCPLCRP